MARCGSERLNHQRIGIFGGSFDPPHIAHRMLVRAALSLPGLDEIWVIPTGVPVHRALSGCADADTRLRWVQCIFAGEPRVRVQDWEVRRRQPTATLHTLQYIDRRYPQVFPVLLLGADVFAGIESWQGYPEHQQLCDVAVFPRAGQAMPVVKGWQPVAADTWQQARGAGHVLNVDAGLPDISATRLRQLAQEGKPLRDWVPAEICAEVEQAYGPA
ncbi:MAG: nicotinate (nicotinamide) nucleotide adenylyltransferase [Mariprofundaceae bacterium]|nr:nicotinate (nicotinamide) nucleotide adenylyltransferase [Mariprofundaceae bacterium]